MLNTKGFGLLESMMTVGFMSLVMLAGFYGMSTTSKTRIMQQMSMRSDSITNDVMNTLHNDAAFSNNFLNMTLGSAATPLTQIVDENGAPVIRTGEVFFGTLMVDSIDIKKVADLSPTSKKLRVRVGFKKGKSSSERIYRDIAGRATVNGAQKIQSGSAMGAGRMNIKTLCNAIPQGSYDESTGECNIQSQPERNPNQLARFGDLGDVHSFHRQNTARCPANTWASGVWVNGDGNYIESLGLWCQKFDENDEPAGPTMKSALAGRFYTGNWAWERSVNCPAGLWLIGIKWLHSKRYDSGYSFPWWNFAFKLPAAICAKRDHSSSQATGFASTPWPNYMTNNSGGFTTQGSPAVQQCQPNSVVSEITGGNQNGRSGPGERYIAVLQGYCT